MFGFANALETLRLLQDAIEDKRYGDFFDGGYAPRKINPEVNVFQKGDDYMLTAEIPGVAKEDLSIEVKKNLLRISGKRKIEHPKDVSFHRVERGSTEFDRTIKLPILINQDKVDAKLEDGILSVFVPRAEEDKPKQISIN